MSGKYPAVFNITVPVFACMHPAEPPDERGASKVGHMHLGIASATISEHGKELGYVSADPACTLVLKVGTDNYHVDAMDVWKAVYEARGVTQPLARQDSQANNEVTA